jgi:type IV secretory pathway VirD2 relaxase
MAEESDFQPRPGRIRSSRRQRAKPFITQALAAAQRAGGGISQQGMLKSGSRSTFGRGRVASVRANHPLTGRSRLVTVKARVVRHTARSAPLGTHLGYLRREGVTRDGEKAKLFGPETEDADPKAFAERCQKDRHHFRFIVSPEDAPEMANLDGFARELVGQMEKDLGFKLDWVAVDHWNTQHPYVHIIVRGVADDGQDLVISRDYIKEGLRAQDLVTQELGPRTDRDIQLALERQVEAERWTQLDRQLVRNSDRHGIIDLAPDPERQPDPFHALKVGRLRRLESLGLAHQVGPGQWTMDEAAETTLRELGERGDIIKRIHRGLTERGIERATASYVLAGESLDAPGIGRLVDRGLDDELKGTAYAVIDGVDAIPMPTCAAASFWRCRARRSAWRFRATFNAGGSLTCRGRSSAPSNDTARFRARHHACLRSTDGGRYGIERPGTTKIKGTACGLVRRSVCRCASTCSHRLRFRRAACQIA